MKIRKIVFILILISVFAGSPAFGAFVSSQGDVAIIDAPLSIEGNTLESESTIFAFAEKQNYLLASDLAVDMEIATGQPGTLSSGSHVNSYFLHFNPVGDGKTVGDLVSVGGSVSFDEKIVALIWTGLSCEWCPPTSQNLDSSDYLGNPITIYSSGELGRGYEIGEHYDQNGLADSFEISADQFSLSMISNSTIEFYSDQLRIVTEASPVPVPGAILLLGSGLVSISAVRRRNS